jgi:uncharacterized protein YxeA
MKKIIIVIVILILIVIGYFILRKSDNYDGIYEIYVEKIDDLSPDRHLIVKRNGKITTKYKHIRYEKGDKKAILCYSENPTVNVFSLDVDELTIVLPNSEEKIAKIIKEEK